MLYQRYFLRMNQSNTTHLISLLLVLVISLAAVHLTFILLYSSNYIHHQQKTTHRNQSLKQTINDSLSFNDNNEFINFDTQNGYINSYNNNSISTTYPISGNSSSISYSTINNNKIDEQKVNLFTSENNIFIEMTHHGFNNVNDNNYQNDYGEADEDKIEDESINFNHNSKTEFNYDSKMSHPYGRCVI